MLDEPNRATSLDELKASGGTFQWLEGVEEREKGVCACAQEGEKVPFMRPVAWDRGCSGGPLTRTHFPEYNYTGIHQ